jgi:NADPH:quinone reductase-like Zn-dependent oxidoreductase
MFGISAAATGKERRLASMLGTLASMPWFQFTPLSLINSNKGVFGVNLGYLWREVDRIRGWAEQLLDLWKAGVVRPQIARTFRFSDAAAAHHYIQDRQNLGKVLLIP